MTQAEVDRLKAWLKKRADRITYPRCPPDRNWAFNWAKEATAELRLKITHSLPLHERVSVRLIVRNGVRVERRRSFPLFRVVPGVHVPIERRSTFSSLETPREQDSWMPFDFPAAVILLFSVFPAWDNPLSC